MPADSIHIEGLQALQSKLGAIHGATYWRAILTAGADMLHDYIAVYPDKTPSNLPAGPGSRWYERSWGPAWMRMDGSIGKVSTATSQIMRSRWSIKVFPMHAIVGNNADYAPYVQGKATQAPVHQRHGWRTDKEAIRVMGPKVQRMAEIMVQRAIDKA